MLCWQAVKGISSIAGPLVSAALLTRGQQAQNQPPEQSGLPPHKTAWGSFGFVYLIAWISATMGAVFFAGVGLMFLRRKMVVRHVPSTTELM